MARVFPWIIEIQKTDGSWKRVNVGGPYATTCYQTKWQAEYDVRALKQRNPKAKVRARDLRKAVA